MGANERLANLRAASMESDILDRQLTKLNDIGFVNIEVKYHLESQSKKYYYESNSFLNKIVIFLCLQMKKIYILNCFFMDD